MVSTAGCPFSNRIRFAKYSWGDKELLPGVPDFGSSALRGLVGWNRQRLTNTAIRMANDKGELTEMGVIFIVSSYQANYIRM